MNCRGCGKKLFEVTDENDHCDDCFICYRCKRRYHFHPNDTPILSTCDDCIHEYEMRQEETNNGYY
jgi:hypothetical protein